MLYRFLIVLFLCLCATSASATFEIIDPTSIGSRDDLDSTTGGTKPVIITDQDEATYIFMAGATGSDIYNVGDLTATDIDVVDSVVFYYKAQDNGTGANKMQIIARINLDTLKGTNVNLTTSWVDYSDGFTTPPGSRGTWDDFEVDSLLFQIVVTAIGGSREVRIAECSVVVFYSSSERTPMYPEKDDACSIFGAESTNDLRRKSAMQNDTSFIRLIAGDGHDDYWKTGDAVTAYHKMNNDDWETGGFGIFLDVIHVKSDCSLQVVIRRYNSSCALQESTPVFPASGPKILVDTTGHYEIQIPQHDWSSGACGDELAVHFLWSNAIGEAEDSVWIRYGVADTYFEHEIEINGTGCGAESGTGNCAGQSTTDTLKTDPNLEGSTSDWVEVGSAGGFIAAITDAVDANYMMENTVAEKEELWFAGITEPGDLISYDSITIEFRSQKNTAGGQPVRVNIMAADSTDPANKFCEIGLPNFRVGWTDFPDAFTIFGAPSGVETCEGTFTTANIETLEITFKVQSMPAGKEARVTKVQMVICYTNTVAAGEQNFRRIRMIKMGKLEDKTIWDEYFDQELVVNEEYETSVTFRMPSNEWVWGK